MTMGVRNLNNTLAITRLFLCFAVLITTEVASSRLGDGVNMLCPRQYYQGIGCKTASTNPDAECLERYNCNDLKDSQSGPTGENRMTCNVKGIKYGEGEHFEVETGDPNLSINCRCTQLYPDQPNCTYASSWHYTRSREQ